MQDIPQNLAGRWIEVVRKDEVAKAQETGDGATEDETNARQRCQVVVELTEDERRVALRFLRFTCRLVRGYQPRVCSSSSSASFATSSPRIGSPSPRDTLARMSGSW